MDHEPNPPPWPPRPPSQWPEFRHPSPVTLAAIVLVLGFVCTFLFVMWQHLARRLATARRGGFFLNGPPQHLDHDEQGQQQQQREQAEQQRLKNSRHHVHIYQNATYTPASSLSSLPTPSMSPTSSSPPPSPSTAGSPSSRAGNKSSRRDHQRDRRHAQHRPLSEVEVEARQLLFHDDPELGERLPLRDPDARGSLYDTFQITDARRLRQSQSMMELHGAGSSLDGSYDKDDPKKAKTIHWHGVNRLNTAWAWMS